MQDEGHPQRRLVGEDAVSRLAVLAEPLAVIRVRTTSVRPSSARGEHRLEERAERGVGGGHLAVIGRAAGEARGERLRGLVGVVRLVEMDPGEVGRPPSPRSISVRRATVVRARALLLEERGPRGVADEAVVVDVEPPVETEARVERKSAHERPGGVPARPSRAWPASPPPPGIGSPRCRARRGRSGGGPRGCWRGREASGRCERGPSRSARPSRKDGPSTASRRCLAVSAQRVRTQRVDGDEQNAQSRLASCLTTTAVEESQSADED